MIKLGPQQEIFGKLQLTNDRTRVIVAKLINLRMRAHMIRKLAVSGGKITPSKYLIDLRGRQRRRRPAAREARDGCGSPIAPARGQLFNIVN
jgi:hypothetical protein